MKKSLKIRKEKMSKDAIRIRAKCVERTPVIEFDPLTVEEIIDIDYKKGVYREFNRDAVVLSTLLKELLPTQTYLELREKFLEETTFFERAVRAVDLLKPSERKILKNML